MTDHLNQLETQKYLVLPQFVSPDLLQVLSDYLWFKQQQSGFKPSPKKRAYELSHEPVLDVVLDYFTIILSQKTGLKLLPTYGFARVYYQGADLFRHLDRPACEFSCTFPLGYSDDSDWPIFVTTNQDNQLGQAVNLTRGALLLYKGEQLYHWREQLDKKWQAQVFLHYVNEEGDNVEHQFDKRGGLSMSLKQLHLADPDQIENELATGLIAQELTSFLKKQLVILKVIRVVKKSAVPVVVGAALLAAFLW